MTIDNHTIDAFQGRPTLHELQLHYPPRFTWPQLKAFIHSGDLGLLKRDKKLQRRYDKWVTGLQNEYGSSINYLLNHRLQWGKPDTLSLFPSSLDDQYLDGMEKATANDPTPEYFKADIPICSDLICIIRNDWPYSVPLEIEHSLIWTRVPVFHPALIPPAIEARIQHGGLWGFTGLIDTVENLPTVESCLPALAEWNITMDMLVFSQSTSEAEETMFKDACKEVHGFVKRRWREDQWETAWFVNPPRLQSVKELAHIHVFARRKTAEEEVS